MSLIAREGGSDKPFEPVPAGTHPAVCIMVVDLGTQANEVYGGEKHEVLIFWELPEQRFELEKDGRKVSLPRNISQRFTLSLNRKSKLGPFLEAWRGKQFSKEELEGFDLPAIVGAPCMIGLIHKPKRDGGMSARVASIMPWPASMKAIQPKAEGKCLAWDLDQLSTPELPDDLPEWVREVVRKSKEYRALLGQHSAYQDSAADVAAEDDIPF